MGEIVIIALVALVILGPQKLPGFMKKCAGYYRKFLDLRQEVQVKLLDPESQNKNEDLKQVEK